MTYANYRAAKAAGMQVSFFTVQGGWEYFKSIPAAVATLEDRGLWTALYDMEGRRVEQVTIEDALSELREESVER